MLLPETTARVIRPKRSEREASRSRPIRPGKSPTRRGREPRIAPWVFVMPSLALFTVVAFAPIAVAVVLSFEKVQVFGGGTWVGLDNYTQIMSNYLFWTSVKNTVVFTLGTVPTSAALEML